MLGFHRSTAAAAVLVAISLTTLVGCGTDGADKTAAPMSSPSMSHAAGGGMDSTASTPTIHIGSFAYAAPASVPAGSKVSVMNMDGEAHTVTADSGGAFDVKAPAGAVVTFTAPTTPGRYAFHCTYHSNMHGVLVVS